MKNFNYLNSCGLQSAARGLVLILMLGLAGCVSIGRSYEGNPIEKALLDKIVKGKTTRAEVLELLGAPLRTDTVDVTGLAERAAAHYASEALTLKIDPALFDEIYVYERKQTNSVVVIFFFYNYFKSDERSDRLAVFFDKDGVVLGVGWTPGRDGL